MSSSRITSAKHGIPIIRAGSIIIRAPLKALEAIGLYGLGCSLILYLGLILKHSDTKNWRRNKYIVDKKI